MSLTKLKTHFTILRIRGYVFVVVVIIGVLWVALLSIEAFTKGGYRTVQESVSVAILLIVHSISAICIPTFVLLDSPELAERSRWYTHAWFELTWLWMLLATHLAAALLFTFLSPSFDCHSSNADSEGQCQLVNMYISIASWITPSILLLFASCFVVVCLRVAKRFPKLWRTPIRLCPWTKAELLPSKVVLDGQHRLANRTRSMEEGSTAMVSRFSSSQPSSRGSSQSLTSSVTPNAPPSLQASPFLPHFLSQSPNITPHPRSFQGRSYSPPSRLFSHVPPRRVVVQPSSPSPPSRSSVMAQRPPPRVVTRPLPLRHPATLYPSRPTATFYPGRSYTAPNWASVTYDAPRSSSYDQYVDGWNRNGRNASIRPTWFA